MHKGETLNEDRIGAHLAEISTCQPPAYPILVTETPTKATASADCDDKERPVSPSGPGIGSSFYGRSRVGVAAKAVPGTCRSRHLGDGVVAPIQEESMGVDDSLGINGPAG